MAENLTPYEQTYGAALGKQPAPAASEPAPAPTAAPEPEPAPSPAPSPALTTPKEPAEAAPANSQAAPPPPPPDGSRPVAPASPAAPAAPAPKRKAWPWVVFGCVLAFLLLVGGCTSCAILTIAALDDYPDRHMYDPIDEPFGGYADDDAFTYDGIDPLYDGSMLTYDEIMEYLEVSPGTVQDGKCSEGLYAIGQGPKGAMSIAPGLYYLEGSQAAVGEYLIFEPVAHPAEGNLYRLADSIVYMGNYFTDLKDGELMAFMPAKGSETMAVATDEPLDVKEPYHSGCYRVGIDIPAGTYVVTLDAKAAEALDDTGALPAGIVMNDLDFDRSYDSDSIAEEAELIAGGKQTLTVKDGQYLELIGAQATLQK